MNPIEFELNETKLKVYPTGEVWKFGKKTNSKEETWFQLFGRTHTIKGYTSHRTSINKKEYITSRIIYKAFNLDWDITITKNNEIDHISRDSLDNNLSNLRVATSQEQKINQDKVINAKGYTIRNGKYHARIKINCKEIHLGLYSNAEEAHNVYLLAVEKYRN